MPTATSDRGGRPRVARRARQVADVAGTALRGRARGAGRPCASALQRLQRLGDSAVARAGVSRGAEAARAVDDQAQRAGRGAAAERRRCRHDHAPVAARADRASFPRGGPQVDQDRCDPAGPARRGCAVDPSFDTPRRSAAHISVRSGGRARAILASQRDRACASYLTGMPPISAPPDWCDFASVVSREPTAWLCDPAANAEGSPWSGMGGRCLVSRHADSALLRRTRESGRSVPDAHPKTGDTDDHSSSRPPLAHRTCAAPLVPAAAAARPGRAGRRQHADAERLVDDRPRRHLHQVPPRGLRRFDLRRLQHLHHQRRQVLGADGGRGIPVRAWNADIESVRRAKSGAVASDVYNNKIVAEKSYMQDELHARRHVRDVRQRRPAGALELQEPDRHLRLLRHGQRGQHLQAVRRRRDGLHQRQRVRGRQGQGDLQPALSGLCSGQRAELVQGRDDQGHASTCSRSSCRASPR